MRRLLTVVVIAAIATVVAAQTSIDETKPAKPDGVVAISNVAGSVDVVGWDRSEVHLLGTLGKDVKRLEFDSAGSRTWIRVVVPHGPSLRQRESWADLTVKVPKESRLEIEAVSAGVKVADVRGPLDLDTVSGAIDVEADPAQIETESVSGDVAIKANASGIYVKTVSGDIEVQGGAEEIEVETVSGGIQVSGTWKELSANSVSGRIQAADVSDEVESSTVSGDIRIKAGRVKEANLESISGDVVLESGMQAGGVVEMSSHSGDARAAFSGEPTGEIHMEAHSGNVALRIPKEWTGRWAFESFSGDITVTPAPENLHEEKDGAERHVSYEAGSNGVNVMVGTHSGDIELTRD